MEGACRRVGTGASSQATQPRWMGKCPGSTGVGDTLRNSHGILGHFREQEPLFDGNVLARLAQLKRRPEALLT